MSSNTDIQPPTSGLVAGKYELLAMIGRGGMGSVWEARHASLGTRFAIKFIEAEYADSAEARSRFDKEARAAATIQSKHAIQIYDHGVTDDGKPYIVMELLQGEPLDKRIERFGRLSLQDTARIIMQVSRGLARAHERGIVHRDLKPENIFLVRTPDDDEEVAKVLDFGIAKMSNSSITGSPSGITSSTKTGAVLGTPFYMSPEQARGLRNVDHRTDIWSLGVIAFKCVTGRLPFDGESVGDLLVKICTSPIPVPSQAAPGLPPAFDAWFARALEREPDRRFSTVAEMSDGLAFSAGIAPRGPGSYVPSSNSPPMSNLPTVGNGQAGPMQSTPYPQNAPPIAATIDQPGYPHSPQAPQGPQAPGMMTANGLSSSQMIPGTSGGRAKYFVLAGLAGLLLAVIGTGGWYWKNRASIPAGPAVASTIGLTAAPGSSEPSAQPLTKNDPPPQETATPPIAANNPLADHKKPGVKPAGGNPLVAPPPSTTKPPVGGPIVFQPVVAPPPSAKPPVAKPPTGKPDVIGY